MLGKDFSEIDTMPAEEVILWRAYLCEPRGEARSDYHAAQVCQAIYLIATSISGGKSNIKLEDNLLKFTSVESGEVSKEDADKRTLQTVMALQSMFGGTVPGFDGEVVKRIETIENDKRANDSEGNGNRKVK